MKNISNHFCILAVASLIKLLMRCSFFDNNAYALVPVESLARESLSTTQSESSADPYNYVFTRDVFANSSKKASKKELAFYRGFYEEGKNLINDCKAKPEIHYANEWEKNQVKRSVMALVQYIGIDLTLKALPQYAKVLEFSRDEYVNMAEGLVGNFCSNNISVMSKREILDKLYLKFDKENNFKLPTVKDNPLFSENLDQYFSEKKSIEQEFLYTVKLFQSLCSWNGNPENPGLMVPILKNAGLMAFFNRQLSGQNIDWREADNSLYLKDDTDTLQVWCDNLICRKVSRENFLTKVFYSVGGTNFSEDFKRFYCADFRNSDYRPKDSDAKIAKMMKSISFDEENFINSQFIALITGIPDLLLRSQNFKAANDFMRANLDDIWTKWAKSASENFTHELYFEEPLTLELIDRKYYQNYKSPGFKVALDVNMGEFDRVSQRSGKIKIKFTIQVQNNFLEYYTNSLRGNFGIDSAERLRLKNRLRLQLESGVKKAREKLVVPPWKGDLEGLIASEVTSQILEAPERFLQYGKFPKGHTNNNITVEINYGLFALKYLNHQLKSMQQGR